VAEESRMTSPETSKEWVTYLRELADSQTKEQIAANIRQAADHFDAEIHRLQREVDYCVLSHDAQLTTYRTALEEICTRRRCPIAEKALGLTDAPCRCPRDSFGHVKCEERPGPAQTYCVAERNAEADV
jgi:hypothetical protein